MKRIVTDKPRTINLGVDEIIDEPSKETADEEVVLPPKYLFKTDLKELQGFRTLRREIKINNALNEFIIETSKILKLFSRQERKYDAEIIKFVCEMAEHTFVKHEKMGHIKERAVIQTCKPFYNNDDELVRSIVSLVLPLIKKTNAVRRLQHNINYFFWVIQKWVMS